MRINCISNLKYIGLACRVWEGDNGDKYPMQVSVTNGGTMELIARGNVSAVFQAMSNELSTPKVLICSQDEKSILAADFGKNFNNSNISYFVGIDVTNDMNPQMLLSGDDNFDIGGVQVKSGLLEVSSNTPISWSAARHHFAGNIGMADGSVQEVSQDGLSHAFQQSGVTNRLAIP